MVGRRLAHYDVNAHLGSGGMGDVYRATDTKLGRTVALKFLRDDLASDPRRAARFQREAKALAALNHPHIAAIHGQEEVDGRTFLVMEFVAGQTLKERIDGRALPVPEAITIALQIIEAVETAHDSGIVHRDLKPANIKITPGGRVKVLDFGLAKMIAEDAEPENTADLLDARTVSMTATRAGVIVGTPAYMSPEQVKGVPADCRSDIFAFGCVLFEMLTGRRAFAGGSASEVLTQVVEREPNWTLLPSSVPASIERLLRLCLEKDPPRRRQSAGDVRVDLERAQSEPTVAVPRARSRWTSTLLAAAAVTLVAGTAVVMWVALRNRDTAAPEMRFQVETPQMPGLDPMHFALSPEGDLVFAAPATVNGTSQLYLRTRNATNPQPISGTEGARYPFWSPDGRSIGFFASSKVFRVDLAGGRPQALAPAINPMGGAWGKDGTILLSPTTVSPLLRVPASSGPLVAATQLQSPHQSNHRWPSFLPDGRHFLFYVAADEESGIYLGSLDGGPAKRLTAADSGGVFLPPDRILFVQEGKLVARHFDATRGELSGDPVTLAAPVSVTNNLGWFSTSAAGVVAFRSGTVAPRQMTWFDRTGKVLSVGADVNGPSVSPDQRYLAFDRTINANRDVWIMDLVRGGVTPLTRHPRVDGFPVWSHDGSQVAFHSQRNGTFDIWIKPSSGSGDEQLLVSTPANEWPLDWSKDGRFLLFQRCDENYSSADLFALPMTGESRTPIVVANGPFEENIGSFSPDARWVTYQTDESGRPEIVVKAFQRPSGIIHVSTDGGVAPRWSADGREIYFVSPDGKMMAAAVSFSGSTLDIGKPVALFQTHIVGQTFTFQYAVTRDARFVMADRQVEQGSASPITVLFNWKP